jgi:cytochrome P450
VAGEVEVATTVDAIAGVGAIAISKLYRLKRNMPPVASRPARPPWRDFLQLHQLFGQDILAGLTFIHRRYGDFVRTRLPLQIYFVADPNVIEEILVKKAEWFHKDHTSHLLARVIGNGLLVNEGASWRRQRRLLQPAFHHQQLQSYASLMAAAIERAAGGWRAGEIRNVHEDMMGVTMQVVAGTLFGANVSATAAELGAAISSLMEDFTRHLGLAGRLRPPPWVPTPANRRFRRSAERGESVILEMIDARRKSGATTDDLLSLLIRARYEEGGEMTDAQVRDEALTIFLAGHETTALALTYALHLLARHPEQQARLRNELRAVLGARPPGLGDLEQLRFTEMVLLEAMRLYPPAWAVGRRAVRDVEVGGYRFPKGAEFVMSPWVVHHDARHFDDPESFRPARWEGELAQRLPRFAYFPFGGGPRVCIGNRFAMMQAKLVLAGAVQRFGFALVGDGELALRPSVTLRPQGPVPLRLEPPA